MAASDSILSCQYLPPPVDLSLTVLPEHPCPYLPDRTATTRAFYAKSLPPEMYHDFMDAGFRRSGCVIYQPICQGCRACLPIRILVDQFKPDKSQRRCWRKNQDLIVTAGPAVPTDEKYELYLQYQTDWHNGIMSEDREAFESYLYDSPVNTLEFCYRDQSGKLLAVGICDLCPRSFSSVYFYHDPAESKRSLGTFGVLYEIQQAREMKTPYYYLGYWIKGCTAMEYKANFRPNEILYPNGKWRVESGSKKVDSSQ